MSINIMHHAPAVYVPTQPEGNGLTMPTLFSLLAHGLVIGLLAYSYQNTETEITGSIETVMVSPEQLAEMQGQILANRAAAQAQAASASSSSSTVIQTNESDSNDANQNSAQPSSQQVPSFSRPDDTAGRPLLMSEEHRQRLLEQNRVYEQQMAELAAALDEKVSEEQDMIEQDKRDKLKEEQGTLGDLRNKERNPPPILPRPSRTDGNLKSAPSGSDNAPQDYDLAKGKAVIPGNPTRSTGQFKSSILSKIQSKLDTPIETQGISTSLYLKLDTKGNVKSAKASGSNTLVNQAVEKAAFSASPLPIDLDNPTSFATLTINVTIE